MTRRHAESRHQGGWVPGEEGQEPAPLGRLGWPRHLGSRARVGWWCRLSRCSYTHNQTPFLPQGNPEEHTILEFAQLIKDLVGE